MKAERSEVSPREVALALGVSESSVKRWSDQGLLTTHKTAGGHRRLDVADVLRFVHEQGYAIGKPELLGLPGRAPRRPASRPDSTAALYAGLIAGDRDAIRRIVVGMFVDGAPLAEVFDDVLAPALHALGLGWEHGSVRVFEEHRAITLVEQVLHDVAVLLPHPTARRPPSAVVAAPSGDPYTVAVQMAELTLLAQQWVVHNLGPDTPAATLVEALADIEPRLLAIGTRAIADVDAFAAAYAPVVEAARATRTTLVLGGPGATTDALARARFHERCLSMRDLAGLGERLVG